MVIKRDSFQGTYVAEECNREVLKEYLRKGGEHALNVPLCGADYDVFHYAGSTVVLERHPFGYGYVVELRVFPKNEPNSHRVLNELEKVLLKEQQVVAKSS